MTAISIIEFLVFGLITYGTFLFIVYNSMQTSPGSSKTAQFRIISVMPALVFSLALVVMSPEIVLFKEVSTITNTGSANIITDTTNYSVNLQNGAWGSVHLVLFFVFFAYILWHTFKLLSNK